MKLNSFNSKLLLFGEYSVIRGSMALSVPYELFDGHLAFPRDEKCGIDPELKAFSNYLKMLKKNGDLFFTFDHGAFEFDVGQGLMFNSSIPQGHGVGSSGALCAAIYDRYVDPKEKDINSLKKAFALMESHFHGSSSGVDPLISFLNRPLTLNAQGQLMEVKIPQYNHGEGALFLLNTGRARRTEPLVNLFLEKCKSGNFGEQIDKILTPITNNCVISFLEGRTEELYRQFRELSAFQYESFAPMIPNLFKDLWSQGIRSGEFYLKLCGAGGGGFLLGMTPNIQKIQEVFAGLEVRPVLKFQI